MSHCKFKMKSQGKTEKKVKVSFTYAVHTFVPYNQIHTDKYRNCQMIDTCHGDTGSASKDLLLRKINKKNMTMKP